MNHDAHLPSYFDRDIHQAKLFSAPKQFVGASWFEKLTIHVWPLFLLAHIPLAFALKFYPLLSTIHALGMVLMGLWMILSVRDQHLLQERILLIAAYIVGAEVLWRMTDASVFWEYGKYAIVLLMGLSLLRQRESARLPLLPLAYFVFLLPSIAFWAGADWNEARQQISFNLSGPFCLAVASLYCYNLSLDSLTQKRLWLTLVAPVISIATLTLYGILTATNIQFTTEANFVTSAGFGPNQVSAALGLGVLACWFVIMAQKRWDLTSILLFTLMLWFLNQALLTFSRGGVYLALISIVVTLFFYLPFWFSDSRESLLQVVMGVILISTFLWVIILPRLEKFTENKLSARYGESTTTLREELAVQDLEVWREHWISGVGPGYSKQAHQKQFGIAIASHTEITRLLAEHGIFGLLALLLLGGGAFSRLRVAPLGHHKALIAALSVWVFAYFLVNAMRVAAPAFLYGLTWATVTTISQSYHHTGNLVSKGLPE